jgi:hypothetical protein
MGSEAKPSAVKSLEENEKEESAVGVNAEGDNPASSISGDAAQTPPPAENGGTAGAKDDEDANPQSPARRAHMLPFELERCPPKLRTAPFTSMTFFSWCRLLFVFRKDVRWCVHFWPILFTTFITLLTSLGWLVEEIFVWMWPTLRGKVTKVQKPVFILGHYRSGTTLLHNVLCLDEEQFQFCSNRHCIFPNSFSVIHALRCAIRPLLPKKRPMDNVMLKLNMPQEDEYAAMLLTGGVSPFLQFFFLQYAQQAILSKYQLFEEEDLYSVHAGMVSALSTPVNSAAVAVALPSKHSSATLSSARLKKHLKKAYHSWKTNWLRFLERVAYDNDRGQGSRRMMLKSPAHTGRVKLLLELFPDAQFIFVHRDPYEVWQSTVHMVDRVNRIFRLTKVPDNMEVSTFILHQYSTMHRAYLRDRALIPSGNLVEVSYADVLKDPMAQIEKIYSDLGFKPPPREVMGSYLEAERKGFKSNKHRELDEPVRQRLDLEWADIMQEFGYATEEDGKVMFNGPPPIQGK